MNDTDKHKKHDPKGCLKIKSKLEQAQQHLRSLTEELEQFVEDKFVKEGKKCPLTRKK